MTTALVWIYFPSLNAFAFYPSLSWIISLRLTSSNVFWRKNIILFQGTFNLRTCVQIFTVNKTYITTSNNIPGKYSYTFSVWEIHFRIKQSVYSQRMHITIWHLWFISNLMKGDDRGLLYLNVNDCMYTYILWTRLVAMARRKFRKCMFEREYYINTNKVQMVFPQTSSR